MGDEYYPLFQRENLNIWGCRLSASYPRNLKLCGRTSQRIREKKKVFLDSHLGPMRC
jgi:hypothetical protein